MTGQPKWRTHHTQHLQTQGSPRDPRHLNKQRPVEALLHIPVHGAEPLVVGVGDALVDGCMRGCVGLGHLRRLGAAGDGVLDGLHSALTAC